ncbi:MAG: hypothetical protein ACO1RX_18820 [Candidatus Sericytochromatia bacterium]
MLSPLSPKTIEEWKSLLRARLREALLAREIRERRESAQAYA